MPAIHTVPLDQHLRICQGGKHARARDGVDAESFPGRGYRQREVRLFEKGSLDVHDKAFDSFSGRDHGVLPQADEQVMYRSARPGPCGRRGARHSR